MDFTTKLRIKQLISTKIDEKLINYKSETDYKPFFEALFSKPTIIQASIMQSLYTSFGMSVYEQIALILAEEAGYIGERQHQISGTVDDATRVLIDKICEKPIGTYTKDNEIEQIRKSIKPGPALIHPDSTVDVFIKRPDGIENYLDITTVKPNKKESRALRRKFLVWTALRLSQNRDAIVRTYMGIPYNPYYPILYSRSFVLDNCHSSEILIQNDLWGLFAGYDVFDELLEIFTEIGYEMRTEITKFFEPRE
jgi:hypothetical protein